MVIIRRFPSLWPASAASILRASILAAWAAWANAAPFHPTLQAEGPLSVRLDRGVLELTLVEDDVLRVHFIPASGATPPTLVMSPGVNGTATTAPVVRQHGKVALLRGGQRIAEIPKTRSMRGNR